METQNEAQPTGPVADADPRERRLIGMVIGGAGYRPAPDWAWRYAIQDRTPLDEPTRSRLKAHLDRAVELAAGLPSPRYLRREPLDLDHLDAVLDTKIGHGLPPSDSDAITAWCLDIAVREMGGWWAPGPPEPLAEPHWVQIPDLGAVAVTAASNSPFSGLISMPPLPRLCAVGADRPRLLDWLFTKIDEAFTWPMRLAWLARRSQAPKAVLPEGLRLGWICAGDSIGTEAHPHTGLIVGPDGSEMVAPGAPTDDPRKIREEINSAEGGRAKWGIWGHDGSFEALASLRDRLADIYAGPPVEHHPAVARFEEARRDAWRGEDRSGWRQQQGRWCS